MSAWLTGVSAWLTGVCNDNGRRFAGANVVFNELLEHTDVHASDVTWHGADAAQRQTQLHTFAHRRLARGSLSLGMSPDRSHDPGQGLPLSPAPSPSLIQIWVHVWVGVQTGVGREGASLPLQLLVVNYVKWHGMDTAQWQAQLDRTHTHTQSPLI